jgi:hypothetical protein
MLSRTWTRPLLNATVLPFQAAGFGLLRSQRNRSAILHRRLCRPGQRVAAHLGRLQDIDVHAYEVSQEHTCAINQGGLRISVAAEFTVHLHATSDPRELPRCDSESLRQRNTRDAIQQTAEVFDHASAVCSIQNGLGNEEIIAEHVKYAIRGATPMAAHLIGPGQGGFEFYSDIWIGPFEPSGMPYEKVEQCAAILARAGLQVVPLQDARGAQWTKLILWRTRYRNAAEKLVSVQSVVVDPTGNRLWILDTGTIPDGSGQARWLRSWSASIWN